MIKKIQFIVLGIFVFLDSNAINVPTLSSPSSGASNVNPNIALMINTVAGATYYDYQLDTVPTFNSSAMVNFSHATGYSGWQTSNLRFGQKYYWHVRARNASDTSAWSIAWNFSVLNRITQSSPSSNSTSINPSIALYLNTINGVTYYDFQVDTLNSFNSGNLKEYSISSSYSGSQFNDLYFGQKYYWRVRARHSLDTTDWSNIWNFTTLQNLYLSSPSNGSTNLAPSLATYINTISGVNNYDYQIDTVSTFNSPELSEYTHNSSYSGTSWSNLYFGKKYYWRARARHSLDTTNWSSTWNFSVKNTISQSSPSTGSTQNVTATLYINQLSGVNNYHYQLDTNINFNSPVLKKDSHTSTYSGLSFSALYYGQKYYWRVRGSHASDTSDWSSVWNFNTKSSPILSSPTNNANISHVAVDVYWNTILGTDKYQYQIDTSALFNSSKLISSVVVASTNSTQGVNVSNLLFGKKYYWRIRAINAVDTSLWSEVRNFNTLSSPMLYSPSVNATNQNSSVDLQWYKMNGASYYAYQFDTVSTFNSPFLKSATVEASPSGTYQNINVNNLKFNKTYYWRIKAMHSSDTSLWSENRNFTTKNYLVNHVSPSNNATGMEPSVTIDWSNAAGIDFYDYEMDTTVLFNSSVKVTGSIASTSSQYSFSELNFGQKYYWRVRVRITSDTSEWSSPWSFQIMEKLSIVSPTNGATSQTPDCAIDWTGINGVNGYQYQADTTLNFNSPALQNGYNLSNNSMAYLNNSYFGKRYYWKVRAFHSKDTSDWSVVRDLYIIDKLNLVSPAIGATNQTTDCSIDWTGITGITGYQYMADTINTFNSAVLQNGFTSSGSSITNLSNLFFGKHYYWKVRTFHLKDTSLWSDVRDFYTLDKLNLVSPAIGAINQTPDCSIDWTGVTGITGYQYMADTTNSFNSAVLQNGYTSSGNSISNLNNLLFGKHYYWKVRAFNTNDTSAWSDVRDFYVLSKLTHVSPANGAINVSLTPTLDWNGITGIMGYQYQYSTDVNFLNAQTYAISGSSQATISGLSYGNIYYWRVRTFTTIDTSAWSDVWSFTAQAELSTPVLTSPVNNASNLNLSLTLQWQSVLNATSYEYQYDVNSNFTSPNLGYTSGTSDVISNLDFNTTYYWKVRAKNTSGYSNWSTVWSFTTKNLEAPVLVSPVNNSVAIDTASVVLNWNDVAYAEIYYFQYSKQLNFSSFTDGYVSSSQATINGLALNTKYYWRVNAAKNLATSNWSDVWAFTTKSGSVNIEEVNADKFVVYPNPVIDKLTLEYTSENEYNIIIYNAQGTEIYNTKTNENIHNIDVSTWNNGLYFINIRENEKLMVKKFVK